MPDEEDEIRQEVLPFYSPHWATPQESAVSRPWPLLGRLPPQKKASSFRTAEANGTTQNGQATQRSGSKYLPERYGADPYYRSVIQAHFLGETEATTYKEYVIALQGNDNANEHMDYIHQCGYMARKLHTEPSNGMSASMQSKLNQKIYEHNRALEARRNVEYGSRLRLIRFSLTDPFWPPHNQEMLDLGLTAEMYYSTLKRMEAIRQDSKPKGGLFTNKKREDDGVPAILDYIKAVNILRHQQGVKVIWTVEGIPVGNGLYEISLWDQSDPLELLVQLEKLGVIEKKRFFDDLEVGESF